MSANLLLRFALAAGLCVLAGGVAAYPPPGGMADRQSQKNLILAFYQVAFSGTSRPVDGFFARSFIQHDPEIEDGIAGFKKYRQHLLTAYPHYSSEIRRITASGGLVTVHVLERLNPWDRGNVQIHMYRISYGAIAEHWVVGNPIPATGRNANGLI